MSVRELGYALDPALGFTPRNGFRRFQSGLSWIPRPAWWPAVRQLHLQTRLEYLTDLKGVPETRSVGVTPLRIRFQSSDTFGIDLGHRYERLREPFEIVEGVVLPAGEYSFNDVAINVRTAAQRAMSLAVAFKTGQF